MMPNYVIIISFYIILLVLSSCGGSGGKTPNTHVNTPPSVQVPKNQYIPLGQNFAITGSGSDTDGNIVSFVWKEDTAVLASTASFNYMPTTVGEKTLSLTVTDNEGAQTSKTVVLTVIKRQTLQAQIKGALQNATVKIFQLEDNGDKTLLFTETTDADGVFYPHSEGFEDDRFYLYQAVGGTDSSDSKVNKGAIRAFVKGNVVKRGNFKLSLASEMLYLLYTGSQAPNYVPEMLQSSLQTNSQIIIHKDINGDSKIDYADILAFDYLLDKSKLSQYRYADIESKLNYIYENKPSLLYNDIFPKRKIGTLDIEGWLIGVVNKTAFVYQWESKGDRLFHLLTYDISTPTDPRLLSNTLIINIDHLSSIPTLSKDGTLLFLSRYSSLKVIDISDPKSPGNIRTARFSESDSVEVNDLKLSKDGSKVFVSAGIVVGEGEDRHWEYHFQIFDVSASKLTRLSSLLVTKAPNHTNKITLSKDESQAYIGVKAEPLWDGNSPESGFQIIDINNPKNPLIIGKFSYENGINKVILSSLDSKVYFDGEGSNLKAVDVSNPAHPVLLNEYFFAADRKEILLKSEALASDNGQVYFSSDSPPLGLYIFEGVSTLPKQQTSQPVNLSYQIDLPYSQQQFGIKLDWDGDPSSMGLVIVDQETQQTIGEIRIPFSKEDDQSSDFIDMLNYETIFSKDKSKLYYFTNSLVLIEDYYGGGHAGGTYLQLHIIDISDLSEPTIISSIKIDDHASGPLLSKDENKIYYLVSNGLQVVDISDLDDISFRQLEITENNYKPQVLKISEDENWAYLVTRDYTTKHYNDNNNIFDPYLPGTFEYTEEYSIKRIDLTSLSIGEELVADSPESLFIKARIDENESQVFPDLPSPTRKFVISPDGKFFYILVGNSLLSYDFTEPNSPVQVGKLALNHETKIIKPYKSGSRAYTISKSGLVETIDLSNPDNPFIIGSYQLGSYQLAYRTKTLLSDDESRLNIANAKNLEVLDISNADKLFPLQQFHMQYFIHESYPLVLEGTKLYIFMGNSSNRAEVLDLNMFKSID